MFDLRLVAYEPNGARLGVLPYPLAVQASLPLCDVGALSLTYSDLVAGAGPLGRSMAAGLEVALEVSTAAGGWVEPAGGRFVRLEQDRAVTDEQRVRQVKLPAYSWMLRKARMLVTSGLNEDGKRPFLSATAGAIVRTLLQEVHARGVLPGLNIGFTSTHDSAGAAWSKVITIYYEPGIDVWTVLDNLTAQGVCDWTMQGRTLQLYNPDGALARDLSTGNDPVTLRLGRDVIDAPQSESLVDVVSQVMIRGEGDLTLTETNPSAPAPWGAWDGYIEQGGVSDEATARVLVQGDLERGSRVRGQYTREVTFGSAQHLPVRDYVPGDYVRAPGGDGALERLRVRQVTLTRDEQGVVGGNVVLNDRVIEAELRRAKRVAGIVGGSSAGGSGARPAPEGPDRRTPAAPTGLVVDSDAYIDANGTARGLLSATWAPVTTASDGTAMEVAGYDVALRQNVVGAPWSVVRQVDGTAATIDADVGDVVQVRVRARGKYATTPGLWSSSVTLTVEDDTTPPPKPSEPVLTSRLATVTVTWDGLTEDGGQMPRDFDRVDVYRESTGTVIGALRASAGRDFLVVTDQAYGAPDRYRFKAVDRSGNESAFTAWKQITVTPLVDADLIGTTISQAISDLDAAIDAVQVTADGKNRIVRSTATPSSPGTYKAGDTWWRYSGTQVIGMWLHDGSAWVAQTLTDSVITNLNAGTITAGTLDAARIAAGTITADKLVVATLGNMLAWQPSVTSDPHVGLTGATVNTLNDGDIGWCLRVLGGTGTDGVQNWAISLRSGQVNASGNVDYLDIEEGVPYRASVGIGALGNYPAGVTRQARVVITWFDANRNQISHSTGTYVPVTNTTGTFTTEAVGTAPAGARYAHVRVQKNFWTSGSLLLSNARFTPAAGGSLIVDGAITTQKLDALAVTADKIAANTITGDKINAGSVRTVILTADSITGTMIKGDAIDGKTITGASIVGGTITGATLRTAATGERLSLGMGTHGYPGAWVYDSSNNQRLSFGFSNAGDPGMWMWDATGTQRMRLLSTGGLYQWAPSGKRALSMYSTDTGGNARLWIEGPDVANVNGLIYMGSETVDGVSTQISVLSIGGTSRSSDYSRVYVTNGGAWHIGSSTRGHVSMDNSSGELIIYPRSNLLSFYGLPTTTSTGNPITMIVSGTGRPSIYRNTSVRAAKVAIADVSSDPWKVLDLPVRDWFDRTAFDRRMEALEAADQASRHGIGADQDVLLRAEQPLVRIPGLVAEEVEEAGLSQFCTYDEAGTLTGVMYDRIPLLLIPVVRALHQQVADLTDRLTTLEGAT